MSRLDCNRCDFRAEKPEELGEHATDAQHWLCVICRVSLKEQETQTCDRCVKNVRTDLATVVVTYALLPAELVHHANAPIPGGDALVMLADGNLTVGSNDVHIVGYNPETGEEIRRWEIEPVGVYSHTDDPES